MLAQIVRGWMQTYSGKQFFPLRPVPESICIEDIAHALSNQCRFAGHTKRFYSVAEHSVRVSIATQVISEEQGYACHRMARSEWCDVDGPGGFMGHTCGSNPKQLLLWGLLHDAAEAYLQDMITPLKSDEEFGAHYRKAEAKLEAMIAEKFGLLLPMPKIVKQADYALLRIEQRDLMGMSIAPNEASLLERHASVFGWEPWKAKARFMERFYELQHHLRGPQSDATGYVAEEDDPA